LPGAAGWLCAALYRSPVPRGWPTPRTPRRWRRKGGRRGLWPRVCHLPHRHLELVSLPADREGRLVAPSDQVGVGERAGGPRPVVDPGRCQLGVQKVVDPDRPHADVAAVVARGRGETEADVERWTPAAVLEREHHPAGTLGRLVLLSAAEPVERQERVDDRRCAAHSKAQRSPLAFLASRTASMATTAETTATMRARKLPTSTAAEYSLRK